MSELVIGGSVRSEKEINQRFEYIVWKKMKKDRRYFMLFFKHMEIEIGVFFPMTNKTFSSYGFEVSKGKNKWNKMLNTLIEKEFIERREVENNLYEYRIGYEAIFHTLDKDKGGWCYEEKEDKKCNTSKYTDYYTWLVNEADNKREHMTPSEKRFNTFLGRNNIQFISQAPVYVGEKKGYILDFYIPNKKIAIEVDGSIHNSEKARKYDAERTKQLAKLGIGVYRIKNEETKNEPLLYNKLTNVLGLVKKNELPNCKIAV